MAANYGEVVAENVISARGRLKQGDVADRMRALGFKWVRQTVSEVEAGRRRVSAEELLALALCLDTTVPALLGPGGRHDEIRLQSAQIGAVSIERLAGRGVNDRAVKWDGNAIETLTVFRRLPGIDPFDRNAEVGYVARQVDQGTLYRSIPGGRVMRMNQAGQLEPTDEPWPDSNLNADVDRALGVEPPEEDEQP